MAAIFDWIPPGADKLTHYRSPRPRSSTRQQRCGSCRRDSRKQASACPDRDKSLQFVPNGTPRANEDRSGLPLMRC